MKSIARRRYLILALILFFSQTLLLIHATVHIDKENVQCQLCVSQAQQSHGLPVPGYHFTAIQGQDPLRHSVIPSIPDGNRVHPYFQRAPPLIA